MWFRINQQVLKLFGMNELGGYDGSLLDILLECNDTNDINMFKYEFHDLLSKRIINQIDNNGCIHFFDVNKMSKTEDVRIISKVIEQREEEIDKIVLPISDMFSKWQLPEKRVYIMPLAMSSLGYDILMAMYDDETIHGYDGTLSMNEFEKIQDALDTLGIHIKTVELGDGRPYKEYRGRPNMSECIRHMIQYNIKYRYYTI